MATETTVENRPRLDPRPQVDAERVIGSSCQRCDFRRAAALDRCPECAGRCVRTEFGPGATVFAATVLRVPVPGREPPYALAYIDLDDGPRILAHVDDTTEALAPGRRVLVSGTTSQGDPLVTPDPIAEEASS